jgi:hypothetical protein
MWKIACGSPTADGGRPLMASLLRQARVGGVDAGATPAAAAHPEIDGRTGADLRRRRDLADAERRHRGKDKPTNVLSFGSPEDYARPRISPVHWAM